MGDRKTTFAVPSNPSYEVRAWQPWNDIGIPFKVNVGSKLTEHLSLQAKFIIANFFEKYNHIPETLKGVDTKNIVDAVIAELAKRNEAAAEAEKQRIEAEKRESLDDLYLYGMQ